MDQIRPSTDHQKQNQKENEIIKEMMPYFFYALIPLAITIAIAMIFAPKMTLP